MSMDLVDAILGNEPEVYAGALSQDEMGRMLQGAAVVGWVPPEPPRPLTPLELDQLVREAQFGPAQPAVVLGDDVDVALGYVADTYVGGFWGSLWSKLKGAVKTIARSKAAKDGLNSMYPGAGDAAAMATQLIDSGAKGDKVSLDQIKKISDAAKSGEKSTQPAHDLLQVANQVRKELQAESSSTTTTAGAVLDLFWISRRFRHGGDTWRWVGMRFVDDLGRVVQKLRSTRGEEMTLTQAMAEAFVREGELLPVASDAAVGSDESLWVGEYMGLNALPDGQFTSDFTSVGGTGMSIWGELKELFRTNVGGEAEAEVGLTDQDMPSQYVTYGAGAKKYAVRFPDGKTKKFKNRDAANAWLRTVEGQQFAQAHGAKKRQPQRPGAQPQRPGQPTPQQMAMMSPAQRAAQMQRQQQPYAQQPYAQPYAQQQPYGYGQPYGAQAQQPYQYGQPMGPQSFAGPQQFPGEGDSLDDPGFEDDSSDVQFSDEGADSTETQLGYADAGW